MVNYEREIASRHSRNPSYTEKPIQSHSQSRDRFENLFRKSRNVSNLETYGNQGAEFGISSSNNNVGEVSRMKSNSVKYSDVYNQIAEQDMPHSPVDSDVSKRNTSVETPSRIPTPTSRRTKNLSKSSPEELIRPRRKMNGRSLDFRFPAISDSEGDFSMDYGDGSPSPATKTPLQRTRHIKRAHSLSTGTHITGHKENIETQSFRSQSNHKKKEVMMSNTNVSLSGKNTSRKNTETSNKATNKISKRTKLQTTDQKKSSPSNHVVCSKAQNKIQTFEKIFTKELPHDSSNVISAIESIGQEPNPWASPPLEDKNSKPTIPASIRAELYDNQDNNIQKWEDSIDFTTDNLTTSPKLTTYEKRLETDSNLDANSASKIPSEYFKNSSSGKTIANREYSPKWTSKSPPISPSKISSSWLDSERKEIFKYRGNAKLGHVKNGSIYEERQSTSNGDDISEISQNTPKESHNEQSNKVVECKPIMPILDADNSSESKKKKQLASFAETQTLAGALQENSEKLNFNSKTEKDQKSKPAIYPLDSSHFMNSEKEIELKDSGKLPFESKLDVDPEERIAAEARLFEPQLADNKSEINSISVMSPTQLILTKKGKNDETPRLDSKILHLETPKVVGAYVETPLSFSNLGKFTTKFFCRRAMSLQSHDCNQGIKLNTKKTGHKDHGSSLQINPHKASTRSSAIPNIINTAHRITASEDLRLIKKEENIQDSDLDILIDEFADANENKEIEELILKFYNDRFLDPELDHVRSDLFQVKSGRFFVNLMMERMKQKLDSASHSFHDLNHGIERLERQVASTSPFDKPTTTAECCKDKNNCNAIPIVSLICSWLYIRLPSSRPEEPTRLFRDRNWKFTWLGLTLLTFLLWYVAELAMCGVFCHPKYSNKNTWQPSDPFFPWAIPTKLDQWTGRFISGKIETILDWFYHSSRTQNWPTHLYSGFDWWEGRSGPAIPDYIASTSSNFGSANAGFGVGSIDDDEILK